MSRDSPETITTDDEFEAALARLLRSAVDHGVDPRGSWVIDGDDGDPDWEAMVFELDGAGTTD